MTNLSSEGFVFLAGYAQADGGQTRDHLGFAYHPPGHVRSTNDLHYEQSARSRVGPYRNTGGQRAY